MSNYDKASPDSILQYAERLKDHTFLDVLKMYYENKGQPYDEEALTEDSAAKGQLGNFLEKYYFGYAPNSKQEADFKEAGVELKVTCIDTKKDGSFTAGERLSITNISYTDPVEPEFKKSHVWEKIRLMLLVHYIRDKSKNRLLYDIKYVNLFTPPKEDLDIIIEDYKKITRKIREGKAHELSESDTMYLGACTKGATAEKSLRPQFYGDVPAKKRNYCLKRQYMDYVLHQYVLQETVPYERIVTESLGARTFEELILEKISEYVGQSDRQLCALFGREYNNNKAQWADLSYRMLGIKSNHAEEFVKANIKVKVIRLEENGRMRESMSFPPFKFCELVKQNWEESDIYEYFAETKFLFVVFKKKGIAYYLRGAQFWNMPMSDLEGTVRREWEIIKNKIATGVQFNIKLNGTISNDLPGKKENKIIHVRPHTNRAAYRLSNGLTIGNIEKDANPLPDGQWMTTQSFWINNDYILEQIKLMNEDKKEAYARTSLTPETVLKRLSCFYENDPYLTHNLRNSHNMSHLINLLESQEPNLPRSEVPNIQVCVHETLRHEKIIYTLLSTIIDANTGTSYRQVSTQIISNGGNLIRNISIRDLWNLFYRLSEEDPLLVACVSLFFYHLKIRRHNYAYVALDPYINTHFPNTFTYDRNPSWILPTFSNELMYSLDELVGDIALTYQDSISFEALIYFWEFEFINAEYENHILQRLPERNRARTCNQVLLMASYYMNYIDLGGLLSVMSCDTSKISLGFELVSRTTAGAVLSRLAELENFLQKENIPYSKHHRIARLNGDSLYIPIFIPGSKQFIIDRSFVRYDRKDFRHREEQIIDLSIISSFQEYEHLLQSIKALNDRSQKNST